ncbi:MAG: DUF2892 domain-containing protein [Rhodocyclaceae bacterium]|nr:DUF2892 domain-containing protein [Rhodocyclaceae bacterium]
MEQRTRMHDGIVGALILLGALLAAFVHPYWLLVPGLIGLLMVQSAFTGFCPVYFALDKFEGRPGHDLSHHAH